MKILIGATKGVNLDSDARNCLKKDTPHNASVFRSPNYSLNSSRRRLVCARETGISLCRLSFIFRM